MPVSVDGRLQATAAVLPAPFAHQTYAFISLCTALLLMAVLILGGCGGDSDSTSPPPVSAPRSMQSGTAFLPLMPPLSANNVWHSSVAPGNASAQLSASNVWHSSVAISNASAQLSYVSAVAEATAQTPVLDHWFFMVNGALADGGSLPVGIGAPAPTSAPFVMTVTGNGNGFPVPNGSVGVTNLQLNPNMVGRQLWKAVPAPNGNFYLRSAESFKVNEFAPKSGNPPSMLVGYGGNGASPYSSSATPAIALDLGYDAAAGGIADQNPNGIAIYMNQQYQPNYGFSGTTDGSQFQQWSYNTNNAQLSNGNGGEIYSVPGQSTYSIGSGSSAPGNQWYAYPNYYLETVVNEPDSNPPFPAPSTDTTIGTDAAGEQAAYDSISARLLGTTGAKQNCSYEGTTYEGIRCQYTNLAATATLTTCEGAVPGYSNPGSFGGTAISSADWQAVQNQIVAECQYAADVQTAFNQYNNFFNQLFTLDGDAIAGIVSDVGIPQTQTVNPIPAEILEGIMYTVLSAAGGPVGGVIANIISTATNVAISANGQTQLTHPLATAVADLYTNLGTAFQAVTSGLNSAEMAILEDWGRLQQIGPATEVDSYNGLGMTPNDLTTAENQALKGYKLTVMQTLLAAGVSDFIQGWPGAFGGVTTASNAYNYPAYGPTFAASTAMYMYIVPGGRLSSSPTATSSIILSDITSNGANEFEVFNGINGWSGIPLFALSTYPITSGGTDELDGQAPSCATTFATVFNYTPTNLSVTFATLNFSQSLNNYVEIAGPDGNPVSSYSVELPAYGYAPVYTLELSESKSPATFDAYVYDFNFSTSAPVAAFPFDANGNCGSINVPVLSEGLAGYLWAQSNFNNQSVVNPGDAPSPGGVWGTLIKPAQKACGVNCP